MSLSMEKLTSLCKKRGFIFQSGEIYGGLNGCWDFGPLGAEMKRNIKDYWWRIHRRERTDIFPFDGSILTHPKVLEASKHTENFTDPLCDCRDCKARLRADQLEEGKCPKCGSSNLTEEKEFNLMFETHMGAAKTGKDSSLAYLRPETAQSIFSALPLILGTGNIKLPFGIAQIGKAFRNEINPRHYIFRSREFEQMEIEYFCHPEKSDEVLEEWLEERLKFYEKIGIPREKIHVVDVPEKERAHYSRKTYDLEYEFPFGQQELEGIAHRGDYDLKNHSEYSGKSLKFFDEESQKNIFPHVIEPSAGVDRITLALLCEAYREEIVNNSKGEEEIRTFLSLHPRIAPIKVACLPLLKKNSKQCKIGEEIQKELKEADIETDFATTGAIGKRYRRYDEIGVPFCITVDFETLGEGEEKNLTNTVTLRYRDTMKQERISISEIREKIVSLCR